MSEAETKGIDKLRILLNAVEGLEDDEPTDFMAELKEAAWNILYENPGMDYDEWEEVLIAQYPAEVVDALGTNPMEAYAALADLWETGEYEDKDTGECLTFRQWAEGFSTDQSVEFYNLYAAEKSKSKNTKNILK